MPPAAQGLPSSGSLAIARDDSSTGGDEPRPYDPSGPAVLRQSRAVRPQERVEHAKIEGLDQMVVEAGVVRPLPVLRVPQPEIAISRQAVVASEARSRRATS